jgi:hypothetical protein
MVYSKKLYLVYQVYSDAVRLTYSAIDDVDFVKFIANQKNSWT